MNSETKYINELPPAFFQTCYSNIDFHTKTKEFCKSYKLGATITKSAKVILVGDVAVGKTCLINRFCHQIYNANYKATIGVDFEIADFNILNIPFHLQIWDTAGQERFKCIAQAYYRSAHAIVIVFDLSNINSLKNCQNWLNDARASSFPDPLIFLVGTKSDLLSKAALKNVEDLAINEANKMKAEYWCVSAKTGENITNLFLRLAALTFDLIVKNELKDKREINISKSEIVSIKQNKNKEKSSKNRCCNI